MNGLAFCRLFLRPIEGRGGRPTGTRDVPAWFALKAVCNCCLALSLGAVPLARTLAREQDAAQEEDVDEDEDEVRPDPNAQQFEVAVETFDQWIYNANGFQPGFDPLARVQTLLTLQTEAVHRTCQLTEAQKQKLALAGRGDIKRFFDRVEDARRQFMLVRKDREKFNDIWQVIQPLQASMRAGLFGDGSLFQKTLRSVLTPEQVARYAQLDQERRQFRYRAKIELALANIEPTVPLTDEQRQKLVGLMLESTKPPRRFGQYDYYVVMVRMSQVPEPKLSEILDPTQLATLKQHLQQVRGMEQFLKQNGELESDDLAPPAKP